MTSRPYNPTLHRLALLTAAATFPLIFMGGLVTSHHAGLAVPDWPNSFGYNMFLFPPNRWVGGIFYEHTHRLMGTVVGMLSIALTVWAWRTEPRRWVRWLVTGLLIAVCVQGTLGGLRVVLLKLDLAIVHGCVAQAVFCYSALVCVVTSRFWTEHALIDAHASLAACRLARLAWVCVAIVYAQLVIGAVMRHHGAGLAIPDFPLSYGKLLPPTTHEALSAANHQRVWQMDLDPVTLGQVWAHFAHRIGAVLVTVAVIATSFSVLLRHRDERALRRPAVILLALLLAQLTLGVLTVLLRKPADVASAHVAVGALVLVTGFVLAVRATRLSRARVSAGSEPAVSEAAEIPEPAHPAVRALAPA